MHHLPGDSTEAQNQPHFSGDDVLLLPHPCSSLGLLFVDVGWKNIYFFFIPMVRITCCYVFLWLPIYFCSILYVPLTLGMLRAEVGLPVHHRIASSTNYAQEAMNSKIREPYITSKR